MSSQPTLQTERLLLRPFRVSDAADVQRLAGERQVAATTLRIPHPYEVGVAEEWIDGQAAGWPDREVVFAVELEEGPELVGSIGLQFTLEHRRAELGYWIGRPYWGMGYATEAAAEVVRWAFEERGLHRITGNCHAGNPTSARVLVKLGMRNEGLLRQHFEKWGAWIDVESYGLLFNEWLQRQGAD